MFTVSYSIQIFIEPAYIISEMKNSTGDAQVRDVQLVHENEAFMCCFRSPKRRVGKERSDPRKVHSKSQHAVNLL